MAGASYIRLWGSTDHINIRILAEIMASGIPPDLGLGTRMWDPCVYVVWGPQVRTISGVLSPVTSASLGLQIAQNRSNLYTLGPKVGIVYILGAPESHEPPSSLSQL